MYLCCLRWFFIFYHGKSPFNHLVHTHFVKKTLSSTHERRSCTISTHVTTPCYLQTSKKYCKCTVTFQSVSWFKGLQNGSRWLLARLMHGDFARKISPSEEALATYILKRGSPHTDPLGLKSRWNKIQTKIQCEWAQYAGEWSFVCVCVCVYCTV